MLMAELHTGVFSIAVLSWSIICLHNTKPTSELKRQKLFLV